MLPPTPIKRPTVTWTDRGDRLALAGSIDERAQLVPVLDHARDGRLVLDLAGITFINSIGVREWIRLQRAAVDRGVRLELVKVAEPLVHQLNIVVATRGASIVSSFFAPYYCEACDLEESMVLDLRLHGRDLAHGRAPEMPCPTCRRAMVFAHPPELYLAFLAG